jgi:hypothetical protein
VEALAKVVRPWTLCDDGSGFDHGSERAARAVLASDWLAARVAAAVEAERERIAQAIQAAKPPHITRDYTPVDAAYDTAARIARESR